MAVSSLDKDVATRLFRMLAVNEQTATSVKRDHASYAKLSLLTQQANLVQQQAVNVVNKVASKAADDEIHLCTALSTEFDDSASKLLCLMNVNETTVATIKRTRRRARSSPWRAGRVLQQQAQEAVDDAKLNHYLSQLTAGTVAKLVCGTMYYLYTQNGREVLSRIAPTEWSNYETYTASTCTTTTSRSGGSSRAREAAARSGYFARIRSRRGRATRGAAFTWPHRRRRRGAARTATAATRLSRGSGEPMDVTAADGADAAPVASSTGTWDRKPVTPICGVLSRW